MYIHMHVFILFTDTQDFLFTCKYAIVVNNNSRSLNQNEVRIIYSNSVDVQGYGLKYISKSVPSLT